MALSGASGVGAMTLVLLAESDSEVTSFKRITASIKDASDELEVRAIDPATLAENVALAASTHSAIILLGRTLIAEPFNTPDEVPVLLGGYYGKLDVDALLPRISLNIDPNYVLRQLEKTGEPVERVLSTISETIAKSREAEELVKLQGVEILTTYAESEREAARGWFDLVQGANAEGDVVWILDDQYLDSSGTYRYLAGTAWRRKLLLISSIPRFSRRGVSIGFVPVLSSYGTLLIDAIGKLLADRKYVPFPLLNGDTVRRVFNKRSLEHVGRRLPGDLDSGVHSDIVIE